MASRRARDARPMPQTSPTEIPTIQAARSASLDRSQHAPELRDALGDVVGELGERLRRPDPEQVGRPVHCRTVERRSRASATRSRSRATSERSRKLSSIE